MLAVASTAFFIIAAVGKAFLLTLLTGGGLGTFVIFYIIFKMMGK